MRVTRHRAVRSVCATLAALVLVPTAWASPSEFKLPPGPTGNLFDEPRQLYAATARGDFNGDGRADPVFMVVPEDGGDACVYVADPDGSGALSAPALVLCEDSDGEIIRAAVLAVVPDADQDGYDDLVIAHDWQAGATVVFGSPDGLSTSGRIDGLAIGVPYTSLDEVVSGDVNGDGWPDVVGARRDSTTSAGTLIAWYGAAEGYVFPDWIYEGPEEAYTGASLVVPGDINGDGMDDLLLSDMWGPEGGDPAALTLFFGAPAGLGASPDQVIGPDPRLTLVLVEEVIGDINGDGHPDAMAETLPLSGDIELWLFLGSATGLDETFHELIPLEADAHFAALVKGPADFDGDGFADLALNWGQGEWDTEDARRGLDIFYGSAAGPGAEADVRLVSTNGRSYVSSGLAGDLDADGWDDLVLMFGDLDADTDEEDYGSYTLVFGTNDLDADGTMRTQDCDDLDPALSPEAADTTLDGIDQDCDGVDGSDTTQDREPACGCQDGAKGAVFLLALAGVGLRRNRRELS